MERKRLAARFSTCGQHVALGSPANPRGSVGGQGGYLANKTPRENSSCSGSEEGSWTESC